MKRGFFIILCMFTLNATTIFVNDLPLFEGTETITPYDADQITGVINATELGDRWDPPESGGLIGDVKGFLGALKKLNHFIRSFPEMLADLGLPASLVSTLGLIWTFMWWLSVGDLISGGKIFGT